MSGTHPEQEWFMTGSGPAHVRHRSGMETVRSDTRPAQERCMTQSESPLSDS